MKGDLKQSAKTAVFLFLLLFVSSRIGLFLHEFVGHALCWTLLGGEIAGFKLFMFGGGWVRYVPGIGSGGLSEASVLLTDLAGLGIELLTGIGLYLVARYHRSGKVVRGLILSASTVLVVHSLWHLVIHTYYGSGDGRVLFHVLTGAMRDIFLWSVSGAAVIGAFFLSYTFSPEIRSWSIAVSGKRTAAVVLSGAIAAALAYGLLYLGEQALATDAFYAETNIPENIRLKEKERQFTYDAYQDRHGRAPDTEAREAIGRDLNRKYDHVPIGFPFGAMIAAALAAGFFRSRVTHRAIPPSTLMWHDIAALGLLSGGTAAMILLLNS